ncbi:MAG: A/G-specific adenine glycosylase [Spirochaetes bacterium]|nr:A/G-specific adenine glycosylase [Spirochaetota bacterium]
MMKQTSFSSKLLKWYARIQRDLPWRKNFTPYSVWISEIMLQQTVLSGVIHYYVKWMERFPDVSNLAKASSRQVLRMWEGLGYYSRASNILKTARIIIKEHKNKFPDNYTDLISLPGIGDYTACAILSIAFKKPCPVCDANVKRVMRRFLAWKIWNRKKENDLKSFLYSVIDKRAPGDFNQALMELGQTVCVNKNPKCSLCPLGSDCQAFKKHIQNSIPENKSSGIIRKKTLLLLLLYKNKILIVKRKKGVLSHLWNFPLMEKKNNDRVPAGLYIKKHVALKFNFKKKLPKHIHYYTKYQDEIEPVLYHISDPLPVMRDHKWVSLKHLDRYPFPSVYRKILTLLDTDTFNS